MSIPLPDDPTAETPAQLLPEDGWHSLPPRARPLFAFDYSLGLALIGGLGGCVLGIVTRWTLPVFIGAAGVVLGLLLGGWIGYRKFRHLHWRLDADGLALRRGHLWQRETRVPITRVQHLDLKRSFWQRRRNLASLTVHTAGTRHSAVTVPHLDAADAEQLRDRLGRQRDDDDDA